MIKLRTLTYLVFAATLGVVATPMAVFANSTDDGRIMAHWESIRAPSVSKAVMINARWHAAGEAYFRVDNQNDVPVYSLSLMAEVDRTVQLEGIDADTSEIGHLDQITSLVRDSATEANRGALTDARAAAYQIAIWHLTDDLSVDQVHVPNKAIRSTVGKLLQSSKSESDRDHSCTGPHCDTPISTATTAATLSVRVGNTVGDAALRIAIVTSLTASSLNVNMLTSGSTDWGRRFVQGKLIGLESINQPLTTYLRVAASSAATTQSIKEILPPLTCPGSSLSVSRRYPQAVSPIMPSSYTFPGKKAPKKSKLIGNSTTTLA